MRHDDDFDHADFLKWVENVLGADLNEFKGDVYEHVGEYLDYCKRCNDDYVEAMSYDDPGVV